MRSLLLFVLLSISGVAFANPFDSFVGTYKVKGQPSVKNSDRVQCRKYDLSTANKVQVIASRDSRSGRTHLIRVFKSGGGASTFTVAEYNYDSGFSRPDVIHYRASTDGRAPNFAMNSVVINSNTLQIFGQLSLGRPGGKVELRISEDHEEDSDFGYRRWSCSFIANLK